MQATKRHRARHGAKRPFIDDGRQYVETTPGESWGTKVQDGYGSLQAFSEAQNVTLSYNEAGELIDRGTTEGAEAIMTLLTDDWGYSVVQSDLDPNDPIVNTASEYMFQMATVGFHVLHGAQTVVLLEDAEYEGEIIAAGTYDVPVEGRYWTAFNRTHPLDGPARGQAWSGTVHGLFAELGVGTVTHSVLQLGLALAGILAGIGLTVILTGLGLVWVSKEEEVTVTKTSLLEPVDTPDPEPVLVS